MIKSHLSLLISSFLGIIFLCNPFVFFAQTYDCSHHPTLNVTINLDSISCNNSVHSCATANVTGGSGNPPLFIWSDGSTNSSICNLAPGTYNVTVVDTFTVNHNNVFQENFDGNHNWSLNVPYGNNDTISDFWSVDYAPNNHAVGECFDYDEIPTPSNNNILHIKHPSSLPSRVLINYGFGGEANKRVESPSFSTLGTNNLVLEFIYVIDHAYHIGDSASVWYNSGTGWSHLTTLTEFDTCDLYPSVHNFLQPSYRWRRFSMLLPPDCNNNPNLQIGFNWHNNNDNTVSGYYLSVGIDSVIIHQQYNTICSTTASITIPPPPVVVIDSTISPYCNGSDDGMISISSTGGFPPYTYHWSNGATSQTITGLGIGTYSVTTTDSHGCTATASIVLSEQNSNIFSFVMDSSKNSSCVHTLDGDLYISINGGSPMYSYNWNNGATTEDLTGITSGNYTITITDQRGCFDSSTFVVNADVILNITDSIIPPLCHDGYGNVTAFPSGGFSPYAYNWGNSSSSTTNSATLLANNYTITISDLGGSGCYGIHHFTVTAPPPINILLVDSTHIGCDDTTNSASISITSTGGTGNHSYHWNNNLTTTTISGLAPSNYTVTVTDENGCTVSSITYPITRAVSLDVDIQTIIEMLNCDLQPIGTLNAVANGGNAITYLWNNNATTALISGLNSGIYTVTATNEFGCTDTISQEIIAPVIPFLNAYANTVDTDTAYIASGNIIELYAGSTGFDYQWLGISLDNNGSSNLQTSNTANTTANPTDGWHSYIVTASATTDSITCTVSDSVFVLAQRPFLGIPDAFTPNGDDANDVFVPLTLEADEVLEFRIYNRWGQEIYNGDKSVQGWDGTFNNVEQPMEVYIYRLSYQRRSATKPVHLRGQVTLIR